MLGAALQILLIGDSVTQGAVRGEGLPYARLLEAALPDAEVANAGCAGSSSLDWVRPPIEEAPLCFLGGAFEQLAEPHLPTDVAVVYLGLNDALGFYEAGATTPQAYQENLEELLASLEGRADRVILVVPQRVQDLFANLYLFAYRRRILEVCDAYAEAECGPDLFQLLEPRLHPDGVGHFLIARALERAIDGPACEPERPRRHRGRRGGDWR